MERERSLREKEEKIKNQGPLFKYLLPGNDIYYSIHMSQVTYLYLSSRGWVTFNLTMAQKQKIRNIS